MIAGLQLEVTLMNRSCPAVSLIDCELVVLAVQHLPNLHVRLFPTQNDFLELEVGAECYC